MARTGAVASCLVMGCWFLGGCGINPSVLDDTEQISEDRGDIQIAYQPGEDEEQEAVRQIIEESGWFDEIADDLNDNLVLPEDISVQFEACDESNAFYDPETVEISMCYELIQDYEEILEEDSDSAADREANILNAALFTFYHELGHALVDQLDLPITGREEDAVDEFAAVMLLYWDEDHEAALSGAWQFDLDAQEAAELDELAYWGEHSLDIQRFYNVLCLIYGSDPDYYAFLVADGDLPEERAETCELEYEQKSEIWMELLDPHLK